MAQLSLPKNQRQPFLIPLDKEKNKKTSLSALDFGNLRDKIQSQLDS